MKSLQTNTQLRIATKVAFESEKSQIRSSNIEDYFKDQWNKSTPIQFFFGNNYETFATACLKKISQVSLK